MGRVCWLLLLAVVLTAGCGGDSPAVEAEPVPDRAAEGLSQAEWQDRLISCLREEGWPVTEVEDGYQIDTSGSTDEAFVASEAGCQQRIGAYPTPAPLTDAEISGLYQLNLDAAECLRGLGHHVAEPPSLDVYAQDYRAMQAPWTPFANVMDIEKAEETCPQPTLEDL